MRRQHSAPDWRGKHQKRFTGPFNFTASGQASSETKGSMLLDVIDKYPCRMPLIVLCIETVASSRGPKAQLSVNDPDATNTNMI